MVLRSRFFADVPIPAVAANDFLLNAIKSHGDAVAMIEYRGRNVTYNQLVNQIYCVANGFHAMGVKKDDKIAVVLGNCIEFPVIAIAAMMIGAKIAPINPACTSREWTGVVILALYILRTINVFTVLRSKNNNRIEKLADIALDAVKISHTRIPIIRVTDISKPTDPSDFANLLQFPTDKLLFPKLDMNPSEDVALILSSSGTTGPPKCAMITHRNIVATLTSFFGDASPPFQKHPNCLVMPLYHVYGLMVCFLTFMNGAPLIVMRMYDPLHLLQILQDFRIPFLSAVPPMIVFLAKDPIVSRYDLSSLKSVSVAASPLGESLTKDFLKRFPTVDKLIQEYGMTECTKCCHRAPPFPMEKMPAGSVGMLNANYDCMIVNVETGQELGSNEAGEIWIRGPQIFKGYLNNPKATRQAKDESGWLHTGDVGYVDNDGYYFITDRLKEMIKVRGFQVAPAELEDLLFQHSAITDCAVIGIPDDVAGELPRAFVVKHGGHDDVTAQDIMEFINGKVAYFKRLNGGVTFVASIPKSASGKILRRELRRQHALEAKTVVAQSKL